VVEGRRIRSAGGEERREGRGKDENEET